MIEPSNAEYLLGQVSAHGAFGRFLLEKLRLINYLRLPKDICCNTIDADFRYALSDKPTAMNAQGVLKREIISFLSRDRKNFCLFHEFNACKSDRKYLDRMPMTIRYYFDDVLYVVDNNTAQDVINYAVRVSFENLLVCFVSGFDRSMFAADSTELCSSDECAVKLRECIIGLGVGICDGDEFCLLSTRPIVNQFVECGIGNDWTKDRQEQDKGDKGSKRVRAH